MLLINEMIVSFVLFQHRHRAGYIAGTDQVSLGAQPLVQISMIFSLIISLNYWSSLGLEPRLLEAIFLLLPRQKESIASHAMSPNWKTCR